MWAELLHSLSMCKQITGLYLNYNSVGRAGHHLAESIRSWGDDPVIQELGLTSCSIPEESCAELLQSLSTCKQVTKVGLINSPVSKAGHHPAQSIRSWGDNPPLQQLHLQNCSIPQDICAKLFESLSTCQNLIILSLGSNNTTGTLQFFVPKQNPGFPFLHTLDLQSSGINKEDICYLTQLLKTHKMSGLQNLYLQGNSVSSVIDVEELKKACDNQKGLVVSFGLEVQSSKEAETHIPKLEQKIEKVKQHKWNK